MLLLRSNSIFLHMKDFVITFVKLTIFKNHNFVLYNALTKSNLLFTLNNRIIPQIFTNFHTQYHSISMYKKMAEHLAKIRCSGHFRF